MKFVDNSFTRIFGLETTEPYKEEEDNKVEGNEKPEGDRSIKSHRYYVKDFMQLLIE